MNSALAKPRDESVQLLPKAVQTSRPVDLSGAVAEVRSSRAVVAMIEQEAWY